MRAPMPAAQPSVGLLLAATTLTTQAWLQVGQVWLLYALATVQSGLFAR